MPRVITDSGGLTSGYMTWLEAQKGLGKEDYILFCNTGLEREETLEFLYRQETELGIPIIWLEYCQWNRWKQVNFFTASRKGEPMTSIIFRRGYLPNAVQRYCTEILKIRVMRDFMRSQGHNHWVSCVGLRADEKKRYRSLLTNNKGERWDAICPLYLAGLTKRDIQAFWQTQPFTLQLAPNEGNCTLCFEKSLGKRLSILRIHPELATYWIEAEAAYDDQFSRPHRMSNLLQRATTQETIDFYQDALEEPASCFCGDNA